MLNLRKNHLKLKIYKPTALIYVPGFKIPGLLTKCKLVIPPIKYA